MITRSTNNATDTQLKTKLLLFFQNRHPDAKCSIGVISYAVSHVKRVNLKEALEDLVADELIEKHTNQQGQLFYCLTTDPRRRELVLRLPARNGNSNGGYHPVSALGSSQMITQFSQVRLEEAV